MLSLKQVREITAVVVPVYFEPSVEEGLIVSILEGVLEDQRVFCAEENILIVVDRDSRAQTILETATTPSSLHHLNLHVLERNRGKAGAIEAGLRELLDSTKAQFFITRDCDGDHIVEEIPKLVTMANTVATQTKNEMVTVMGARPSLKKPMGWVREEWELLTNEILTDLIEFNLARDGRVIDKRFLGGERPDIQSGFRVYSRKAAEITISSLESLPEDRSILTFACEFVPFAELMVKEGLFAQVQRMTLVGQPVSSYGEVDYCHVYAKLCRYIGERLDVTTEIILRIADNYLASSSLFLTDYRPDLVRFRGVIADESRPLLVPEFT